MADAQITCAMLVFMFVLCTSDVCVSAFFGICISKLQTVLCYREQVIDSLCCLSFYIFASFDLSQIGIRASVKTLEGIHC